MPARTRFRLTTRLSSLLSWAVIAVLALLAFLVEVDGRLLPASQDAVHVVPALK